ncbi:pyrroline-5-carboxylate reductase [Tenacibaculum sp. IB213877]|uniref:pyrroline-5-carboxylate reductase n=1 Tax=Tenacibaculum sp. IB213877 TaxID=3097351 RepID=UPI002A5AC573|nr:pyrroline-5-carboxylate reductase [Tenacibaculum sp. IB213877]MDY0780376.1 pyrroline-5-carboxylate reductase [Tenacibaculum sp. IB213877]
MNKIAIIGAGKLGCAIADGLLESGIDPNNLSLTRRKISTLQKYTDLGVLVTTDNNEAVKNSEIIILCVKPQKTKSVLQEIASDLNNKIIISTVTGITITELKEVINLEIPLFRAMPNTAAAIKQSMTCVSTINSTDTQKELVTSIFKNLGEVVYIEDELMASATVLAASGIAFALRYIRASMQGGIEIGFSSELAQKIAAQTIKGAAELILQHGTHPESEIDKVTTPQGITITGLNKMEQEGFSSSIVQGILASQNKIENL